MSDHPSRTPSDASTSPPGGDPFDENIRAVARIQQRSAERRTVAQRLSDRISALVSRESMVTVHVVWFGLWMLINLKWLPVRHFDPFPFSLLTTIVSLEAIFLTLFILASQNRMTREADHRAHLDLQVNLLAEQEMTLVLKMLREICDHLHLRQTIDSQQFAALAKRTDVVELADHLERTIGNDKETS